MFREWEELVGKNIAMHAKPVSVDDGVLLVVVDEPAWATRFKFECHRLPERIGFGVVDTIDVRVRKRESHVGPMLYADEIVGAHEIYERLGYWVSSSANDFPRPVVSLSVGLLWYWPDVKNWGVRNGRLPAGD